MFRFAEPLYLIFLALVPLLVLLFWLYRRKQRRMIESFADMELMEALAPMVSPRRIRNKFLLFLVAFMVIVVALSGPQFGSKLREQKSRGVEIIIATDVSNSMLAEDFRPNRLERTKNAIGRLVEQLSDHRLGLVVFASDAYVQLPVTSDYVSARGFIPSISPNMVSRQGTSLSAALERSISSFSSQSDKSRVVILITDGESHDDDPMVMAQKAKEAGVVVYTIGMGTPEGAPIKINGQMLRDENGEIVVSKLDEATLTKIASETGGLYIRATERDLGLQEILRRIDMMQKEEFSAMIFQEYNDQYYYLLAVALLILVVEFVMIERKNRLLSRITVFKERKNIV